MDMPYRFGATLNVSKSPFTRLDWLAANSAKDNVRHVASCNEVNTIHEDDGLAKTGESYLRRKSSYVIAGGGDRTRTILSDHRILSPARSLFC